MKASRSASTMMAAKIAFNTIAAGPTLQGFTKMDAIAESKTQIRSVPRAFLIGSVAAQVLPRGHLESQAATIGLRSESADLIHLREVFRASGEKCVRQEALVAPSRQRKRDTRRTRRPPLHAGACKAAARAGGPQRHHPFARQVDNSRAV